MDNIFHGTRGNRRARVVIVGEAYGQNEAIQGFPFAGKSGTVLDNLLRAAGISPGDCFFTNVINQRPPRNDFRQFLLHKSEIEPYMQPMFGLYPSEELLEALVTLHNQIAEVNPDLIIALGNYALWALGDDCVKIGNDKGYKIPSGIHNWRGSQIYTRSEYNGRHIPLMPTIHPAATFRDFSQHWLLQHDLRTRAGRFLRGDTKWEEPEYNFYIEPSFVETFNTLNGLINAADISPKPMEIAVDIETRAGYIDCIGIAYSKDTAVCIPFVKYDGSNYFSLDDELTILSLLRELLTHCNIRIIGQNFLYDAQMILRHWKFLCYIYQDTQLMHHLCYPGTRQTLGYLSSMYCEHHRYWKEDASDAKVWDKSLSDTLRWEYNCRDCVKTLEIANVLEKLIHYYKLEDQWITQQDQQQYILIMMMHGVAIDHKYKGQLMEVLSTTANDIGYELEQLLPEDIYPRKKKASPWYTSPKQLSEIFYDIFKAAPRRNKKTKSLTTDDEALMKIGDSDPLLKPLTTRIRAWRKNTKFDEFASMKVDTDARIRCSYLPTAETFRWRSSESVFGVGTNLQNIPKGDRDWGLEEDQIDD